MKNYYEILGMDFNSCRYRSQSSMDDEIATRVTDLKDGIERDYSDGKISEVKKRAREADIDEAVSVLSDFDKRSAYNERLSEYLGEDRRTSYRVLGEEAAPKTAGRGRKFLKGLGLVALCATIIVTSVVGTLHYQKFVVGKGAKTEKDVQIETQAEQSEVQPDYVTQEDLDKLENQLGELKELLLARSAETEAATEAVTETEAETEAKATEAAETEEQTEAKATEAAETEEQTEAKATEAAETEEQTEAKATEAAETEEQTEAKTTEAAEAEEQTEEDTFVARNMGSVEDPALVSRYAVELLGNLNAINVLSVDNEPYTQEYIQELIQFAHSIYVPRNMADIDQKYLDLIHILQSPLYNEGGYGYHIAYVSGVEELKAEAENTQAGNNILLVDPFLGYGSEDRTTYQFAKWLEGKRIAIYSTTDRDQVSVIYNEVGQAMADIMKGDGFTFTAIVNNVERTYTVTAEMLADEPAATEVVIGQFLLTMQNRRDYFVPETGEIIAEKAEWEVTNRYNPGAVDVVSYDEENAWVNPDCTEKWPIDGVMSPHKGYTLDQIAQMTLEGKAQNLGFMYDPSEFTYIEIANLFQQDGPILEKENN